LVAVRGGGHNVAGNAVCNGGLMIDLSAMRSVRVDPVQTTARAEAGATWGEFDRETSARNGYCAEREVTAGVRQSGPTRLVHRIRQIVRRRSARHGSPACPHTDRLNHVIDSEH
jgi:hypothetical protein